MWTNLQQENFRATFRFNDSLDFAMKYKTEKESAQPLRVCFSFLRTYISRATLFLKIRYRTKF